WRKSSKSWERHKVLTRFARQATTTSSQHVWIKALIPASSGLFERRGRSRVESRYQSPSALSQPPLPDRPQGWPQLPPADLCRSGCAPLFPSTSFDDPLGIASAVHVSALPHPRYRSRLRHASDGTHRGIPRSEAATAMRGL